MVVPTTCRECSDCSIDDNGDGPFGIGECLAVPYFDDARMVRIDEVPREGCPRREPSPEDA